LAKKLTPTIKCEICYEKFRSLAGHLRKHGYKAKRYKEEFDAPVVSPLTLHRIKMARLRYILRQRKPKREIAVGTGRPHTEEAKQKIREARLGKSLSESHKLAISAGLLGHPVSEVTRERLRSIEFTDERRRNISRAQSAEKSNSWRGGRSRHLYFGKNKYRLKKIFGEPLKCFFPGCDKIEGENVRSVDCHHLDGDHENNPLDGINWLPLCRRHHMLADGRTKSASKKDIEAARELAYKVHAQHMKNSYIGEVKSYHD
jgi:hypothetical protein